MIVRGIARTPAGVLGDAVVKARLVSSDASTPGFLNGGGVIVDEKVVRGNSVGAFELDLTPNASITPAGTYYRVTIKAPYQRAVEFDVEIQVPATGGPYDIEDILVEAPEAPPPAYLTGAQLAAHKATVGDHDDVDLTGAEEGNVVGFNEDLDLVPLNVATDAVVGAAVLVETNARITDVNAEEVARIAADDALAVTIATKETPAGAQAKADAAEVDAVDTAQDYTDSQVTKVVIDLLGIDAATLEGLTVAQLTTAITAAIVDASPATLDTLNELAAAIGDDPNFAATIADLVGAETAARQAHEALANNPHEVTKAQVGLANADNTSDANKPVSTAAQTALDLKQALSEVEDSFVSGFMSNSKGRVVGTSGKAPVAIRFDDYQDNLITLGTLDLLVSRGLPASIALVSRLDTNPWNQVVTWADLKSWNQQKGMEVWSHGTDHNTPAPDGSAGLIREIVTSKAEIEAQGIRVMGWAAPGVSPNEPGYGPPVVTNYQNWDTEAGRLLMATYALSETDMTGNYRHVPSGLRHGLGHITVSDGMTLAAAQAHIDAAIALGRGLEIMCHAGNLGVGGNMTVANFTTLLDYIVTKRDAGLIEVLTPSSLAYADPFSTHRLNLIGNGNMETVIPVSLSTGEIGQWGTVDGVNRFRESVVDGPLLGITNVLRFNNSTLCGQAAFKLKDRGIAGQTMILEGWCRAVQVGAVVTAAARVFVQDTVTPANFSFDKSFAMTLAWAKVRAAFTPSPLTDSISMAIGRGTPTGSGQVQWDDVSVRPA